MAILLSKYSILDFGDGLLVWKSLQAPCPNGDEAAAKGSRICHNHHRIMSRQSCKGFLGAGVTDVSKNHKDLGHSAPF